ncbi:OmpA family protein [Vulcaniibacterium gelatinicum]|uniref:OmpA family protein n=1 Tax=Vulcaniibacterium gelatinicum TaxID=2598725 RepID=UPI0011C80976|nr:OmpA family protein [Vulcaniibacterium gelatinicum]
MKTLPLFSAALAVAIAGCASYTGQTDAPDDPNRTRTGAIIGAVTGAVVGAATGDDATERRQRALVGAAVGAGVGAGIGAYQDRQEAELRKRLAGSGVDVIRQGDNIILNMPSGITFDVDSAAIKPQFQPVLDDVAATLSQYHQTRIEVAGHTDSTGSEQYNQQLSERRAQSVANYLAGRGVAYARMTVLGYGETRPVATNETAEGRARNRRVEITIVPVAS